MYNVQMATIFFLLLALVPYAIQRRHNLSPHLKNSGCQKQKSSSHGDVYATVSSLSLIAKNGKNISRQIEVNWNWPNVKPGDQVALYNSLPPDSLSKLPKPMVIINASNQPSEFFRTDIEFPYVYFNLTSLENRSCMGYYVAYFSQHILQASSCLQIRPFWMQENKKYLQNLMLSQIMIPGSHDSGCFTAFRKQTNTLVRYKYAQEEPIFNQLAYGLRYFDLRVGYYPETKGKYYINHSYFKTDHSLNSILSQVRAFLDATQEIIILDFHLFPMGFDELVVHLDLMKLIYSHLKPYMIPYDKAFKKATIGELWAEGKRVLVSYDNDSARKMDRRGILWPAIPRAWGNKQYPQDLKRYFEDVFSKPTPNELWASMAELTPNARFIVIHPFKGLRTMADDINRNVTQWFRDRFWDKANIVATDYFLGNNLIDVAIETNRFKSFCLKKHSNNHL